MATVKKQVERPDRKVVSTVQRGALHQMVANLHGQALSTKVEVVHPASKPMTARGVGLLKSLHGIPNRAHPGTVRAH